MITAATAIKVAFILMEGVVKGYFPFGGRNAGSNPANRFGDVGLGWSKTRNVTLYAYPFHEM